MGASTLRLTLRSWSAMYGFGFVALAAMFFSFAGRDYYQGHRSAETMVSIAVLFLCIGGAFFLFARQRAAAQMGLVMSGRPGQGVVTAIREVYIGRKSSWFQVLEYSYESSPGQVHKGRSELLTTSEGRDWNIGARGAIKFDAANPARSVWIGKGEGP
jgi:hypothetical protein